jgi:hypothetical protein
MRRLERQGMKAEWPQTSHYDHEAAVEATLDPDGVARYPNRYARHMIGVIVSSVRKKTPALVVSPSDEASCSTSQGSKSKYRSPEFTPNLTIRSWENIPGREWMDLPTLFKFACKIIHRHYGRYIHYEDFNDLIQEAWLAVHTKAVPRFDPAAGAAFTTFAYKVMENHIIDFVRKEDRARAHLDHGTDMNQLGPGHVTL